MKKLSLLVAGIMIVSASTFATVVKTQEKETPKTEKKEDKKEVKKVVKHKKAAVKVKKEETK